MDKQKFMRLSLNKILFNAIFEVKKDDFTPVLEQYKVTKQELYDILWKELHIPDMEVRIANTAMDFLIDCCETKHDLRETLIGEIRNVILAAGVFHTNIAPDAVSTDDFEIPDKI